MKIGRFLNRWSLAAAVLVIVIIAGAVVIGLKSGNSRPVEISLGADTTSEGDIYITGAVTNPGIYPLESGDTLEDVLRAAGGLTANADFNRVELNVPEQGQVAEMQKVNINTACLAVGRFARHRRRARSVDNRLPPAKRSLPRHQ